jgi:hypothetical protein
MEFKIDITEWQLSPSLLLPVSLCCKGVWEIEFCCVPRMRNRFVRSQTVPSTV